MIPTRKIELANWIRSTLGEPVIDMSELESGQLENCIDDAIDYFQQYAGGTGHVQNYCVIQAYPPGYGSGICSVTAGPFSFCDPTLAAPLLNFRHEYQLPKNVLAVSEALAPSTGGFGGSTWLTTAPGQDIIERGINAADSISQTMWGGVMGGPINTTTNNYVGLFFPGTFYSGGPYGTRGGSRTAGLGVDVITYELGMEFMEMLNQRYRVHVQLDFHPASRKVRISPPPKTGGSYIIAVWTREDPEHLYDDYFVRHYALALATMQVGRNLNKYKNVKLGGGAEFNADFYYSEGKESKKELEDKLMSGMFGNEPPPAFIIG